MLCTHGGRLGLEHSTRFPPQLGPHHTSRPFVSSKSVGPVPFGLLKQHTAPARQRLSCKAAAAVADGSYVPAAKRTLSAVDQATHKQPRQTDTSSSPSFRRPKTVPDYQVYTGSNQPWHLPTGLAVTWLGTSSGAPTRDRNISCTVVRYPDSLYMVDTGEGTYRQLQSTGLNAAQVGLGW
jgi:hypothetical protein